MGEVTPLHPADDDEELRAADGRVPGRRGRATRQRLLECTGEMLTTTSYRDVKVIDIAREAGTSPATFYQYFADVEAAILVLAEEMAQQGQHLTAIITDGSWTGEQAYETSLTLVDAFLAFWDDHRPVLRVMDLATDEGDGRFQKIRVRLLNDITNALADVTRASQVGGALPQGLDPMAVAGTLVSMLAHTAAHQYGFEFWGIRTAKLRQSMARQVSWGITGITPPDG
jgi:AcrR family transcriptional regulator